MEVEVYEGDCWFRKECEVETDLGDHHAFVEIEGASQHVWVYLKGKLLGEDKNCYSGFCYSMDSALNRKGRNILALRVKNGWNGTLTTDHVGANPHDSTLMTIPVSRLLQGLPPPY